MENNNGNGLFVLNGGGFSVNSLMMKSGISPITTLNSGLISENSNKVSDLFHNLVIPNWTLSYNNFDKVIDNPIFNPIIGGNTKTKAKADDSDDDDVITDELFDKLFELVKHHDVNEKRLKKKKTHKYKKTDHDKNKSRKSKSIY